MHIDCSLCVSSTFQQTMCSSFFYVCYTHKTQTYYISFYIMKIETHFIYCAIYLDLTLTYYLIWKIITF